jgi:hypothetical protein
VLRAVLALVVIAALTAGYFLVQARRAETRAAERGRNAAATALISQAQLLLSGTYPGVADDVLGMQLVLAARSFPSDVNGDQTLLNAVTQERDVVKIIKTSGIPYTVAFSPDGKRLVVADGNSIGLCGRTLEAAALSPSRNYTAAACRSPSHKSQVASERISEPPTDQDRWGAPPAGGAGGLNEQQRARDAPTG